MSFALGHALDEEFSCQVSKLQRFVKHGPSLGRFVERLNIALRSIPFLLVSIIHKIR